MRPPRLTQHRGPPGSDQHQADAAYAVSKFVDHFSETSGPQPAHAARLLGFTLIGENVGEDQGDEEVAACVVVRLGCRGPHPAHASDAASGLAARDQVKHSRSRQNEPCVLAAN